MCWEISDGREVTVWFDIVTLRSGPVFNLYCFVLLCNRFFGLSFSYWQASPSHDFYVECHRRIASLRDSVRSTFGYNISNKRIFQEK